MANQQSIPTSSGSLIPSHALLAASIFASTASLTGLRYLFATYTDAFPLPTVLDILLRFLPETTPTSEYVQLVHDAWKRQLGSPAALEGEDAEVVANVTALSEKRARKKLQTLHLNASPAADNDEADALTAWFLGRARYIDRRTGLISLSHQLCTTSVADSSFPPSAVRQWAASVVAPCEMLIYTDGADLSLEEFEKMPSGPAVRLILASADVHNVASRVRGSVVPYLANRLSEDRAVLWEWIVQRGQRNELAIVRALCEGWEDGENSVMAFMRACYACPSASPATIDNIHAIVKLLSSRVPETRGPQASVAAPGSPLSDTAVLTAPNASALHLLELLTTSASLTKLNLAQVLAIRQDVMKQSPLLLQIVKAEGWMSRDDTAWRRTRDHIHWLQNKSLVLSSLSDDEVESTILSGMLSAGRFGLAKELYVLSAHRTLSPDQVEKSVLAAFSEFYDNATSGNRTRGGMKQADTALSLIATSKTPEASRARKLLDATHSLAAYNLVLQPGVPVMPVQIRLYPAPVGLIEKVLDSNREAYKNADKLMRVVNDLIEGTGREMLDATALEAQVVRMCIEAALTSDDFDTAYNLCSDRLLPAARASAKQDIKDNAWLACYQAGRYQDADVSRRLKVLSFAIEICPAAKLPEVLTAWRACETEWSRIPVASITTTPESRARVSTSVDLAKLAVEPPKTLLAAAAGATRAAKTLGRILGDDTPLPPTSSLLSASRAARSLGRSFASLQSSGRERSLSSGSHGPQHEGQDQGLMGLLSGLGRDRAGAGEEQAPAVPDIRGLAANALTSGLGWMLGADVSRQSREQER
ncbi:hypothetical protein YB2330_004915 [Saitoella coloradoensis]